MLKLCFAWGLSLLLIGLAPLGHATEAYAYSDSSPALSNTNLCDTTTTYSVDDPTASALLADLCTSTNQAQANLSAAAAAGQDTAKSQAEVLKGALNAYV